MSKEVKAALKEAKEFVKNKEYKSAIKKCNEVLNKEKDNYMALLLLGAAYQDTNIEEATKYLSKAKNCTTDPTLALQGLLKCSKPVELPALYGELLQLTPDKFNELHPKIVSLSAQLDDINSCIQLFEAETKVENSDQSKSALNCLSEIYCKAEDINEKWNELFERALESSITEHKTIENSVRYKKYLKLLQKLKKYEELTKRACCMLELFSNDFYPLEHICKVYVENYENELFNIKDYLKNDINYYINLNLELNPKSQFGMLAQGVVYYQNDNYIEARNMLNHVNDIQPNWNICLKLLIKINMKMRANKLAESLFRQMKVQDVSFLECLIEEEDKDNLNEAAELSRNLLEKDDNNQILLSLHIKACILINDYRLAEEGLDKLKKLNELSYTLVNSFYNRHKGDIQSSLALLNSATYEVLEFFMEKGITLFENENYNDALLSILKATKLQPYNSQCFYWLGKIYLKINDDVRASKCLEKCVSLNPLKQDAFVLLSNLYQKTSKWDENLTLLQKLVNSSEGPKSKWALLQLGLHYLSQKNYNQAITVFRSFKRYDEENLSCLEGLADSYFGRGSFHSALMVFEKICSLAPNLPYPQLQVANTKNILRMHVEALESYEALLAKHPKYLPALKGIAEAYADQAKYLWSRRMLGRCREYYQKAIDYTTEAIQLKNNYICLWRLLANILDCVAQLPGELAHLSLDGFIVGNSSERVSMKREQIFEFSTKCFYRALKFDKTDSSLWYDLAVNYYIRAKETNAINLGKKMELLNLANESAKYAIKLSPTKSENWNLLGVISSTKEFNNIPLAQHCFIQAVTADKKSAISWSNLGILYLSQSKIKLANKAFSRAQQSNTQFQNAWIGQAQIAEIIGQGDESMDLYRHCTELGFHLESSLGYANWVCSLLNQPERKNELKYRYQIENMFAISIALDNIFWYCQADDTNVSFEALTMMSFLYTKQNLYSNAVKALEQAIEKIESGCIRDNILCNLGYYLIKSSDPQKAIEYFEKISENSFKSIVGRALAHFKASLYQESYALYEAALGLAQTDEEKAQVLVAMSAMVYAFQGESDAKSVLHQCLGIPNPPVQAVMAACALALIHKDVESAKLSVEALSQYESDPEYSHHAAFLISQYYLLVNKKQEAFEYLLSIIHIYPDRPLVRKVLMKFLLKNNKEEKHLKLVYRMVESISELELKDATKKQSSLEMAKSYALASESMRSFDEKQRKILAQEAIHFNPSCKEAWAALISCS